MDLSEPVSLGEPAGGVVVHNWEGQSDGESGEKRCVETSLAKDSLGCERAKEYCCGEVRLNARASEAIFLSGLANIGDVEDLEVHDACTNDGGNNSYESG